MGVFHSVCIILVIYGQGVFFFLKLQCTRVIKKNLAITHCQIHIHFTCKKAQNITDETGR
jgi:hypothetical protein